MMETHEEHTLRISKILKQAKQIDDARALGLHLPMPGTPQAKNFHNPDSVLVKPIKINDRFYRVVKVVEVWDGKTWEKDTTGISLADVPFPKKPGSVVEGPVQIGKTWVRMALLADGETLGIEVFDGNQWKRPDPCKNETSFTLGDIWEAEGISCPCDKCWREG